MLNRLLQESYPSRSSKALTNKFSKRDSRGVYEIGFNGQPLGSKETEVLGMQAIYTFSTKFHQIHDYTYSIIRMPLMIRQNNPSIAGQGGFSIILHFQDDMKLLART